MKDERKSFEGMTRREFLYLSGLGMAGMSLARNPDLSLGAEKKPKYGGRMRVGERYGSYGLDAHRNQDFIDFQNYTLMYNALTVMGPLPQVRMYPDLAKSWEVSMNGREFVFPLREGVKFHHGKEMDSGDVKYSFDRVMNPKTRAPKGFQFKWVDSIKPIDKYHIKFTLKEPFAPFLTCLTIQSCPIIPAGWEPSGTKPAPGTGPFVFKAILPNETTEYTRFDQYWEIDEETGMRLPYLDSMYVKKITDATVRWVALRAGDLDYIQDIPRNILLEEMKKPTPEVVAVTPQPVGCIWIYFNVTKPPFDKQKVRQAIAYGVNKEEAVKAAWWGLGEPTNNQPFLNRSRMYIPVTEQEYNPEKAKQLLAEAGFPSGLDIEFLQFSYPSWIAVAEAVIGQLKQVGIRGTMKVIDRAPHMKAKREGNFMIMVDGDSERMDPDDAYYMRLHSGEIGLNNFSRYSNKRMDELLEKGRTTWEWKDRVPVYQEIVGVIKEELPIFYVAKSVIGVAYRDYVKGHEAGAATWFLYYKGGMKKVWYDK